MLDHALKQVVEVVGPARHRGFEAVVAECLQREAQALFVTDGASV